MLAMRVMLETIKFKKEQALGLIQRESGSIGLVWTGGRLESECTLMAMKGLTYWLNGKDFWICWINWILFWFDLMWRGIFSRRSTHPTASLGLLQS